MPCNNTINNNVTPGATPPAIPGFGTPFAPPGQSLPTIPGMPEDLQGIFNALQFIISSGTLKPGLAPNYSKDVLDGILSLLDQAAPILLLYKMLLPALNMIVCIINVLCAIANPFKLIDAMITLFTTCLPQFLAIFPQFALIVFLLSLLATIIAFIEYVVTQILVLVALIQQNINTIEKALALGDQTSVFAATSKIGSLLCSFQNLFVTFSALATILEVIQDILKLIFPIPPCSDNGTPSCCDSSVCPAFIKNNTDINSNTGTLQYYNEVSVDSGLVLPPQFGTFTADLRKESWQLYDTQASVENAFINITNAFDLPPGTTTIFFPLDSTYTATTDPSQAPYLVDLRLFYVPAFWGNTSDTLGPRYIRINNCIVLSPPTTDLISYDNSDVVESTGVLEIAGGLAFEDDGTTVLNLNGTQATLNSLIHLAAESSASPPPLLPTDGYMFSNITYDFKIQHAVLLSKTLITLGCVPAVAQNRTFINTAFAGNAAVNLALLNNLTLPDIPGAQLCLSTAISALQSNLSQQALADFQATTTACLGNLQDQTTAAAATLLNIGVDPFKSTFTVSPSTQFTTQTIEVAVSLVESNGQLLTTNMPASLATTAAQQLSATINFGNITPFSYDGYQSFVAQISSPVAGSGTISVAFDNNVLSTITISTDPTQSSTITPIVLPYKFIFSPVSATVGNTGEGDTDGAPRRDGSDIADSDGS